MKHTHDSRASRVLIAGASRGLGAALAARFAAAGASVFMVARDGAALTRQVETLRARYPAARVDAAPYDLADKRSILPIVGEATDALGGSVNVAFCCAAALGPLPLGSLADLDCEAFEDVLALNLLAPFRLGKALAPQMALDGGGTLGFITSDASLVAYPGWGPYGVSKAGLDQLCRAFAVEFPQVRALLVDPGEMATDLLHAAMPHLALDTVTPPARVADWIYDLLPNAVSARRYVYPEVP